LLELAEAAVAAARPLGEDDERLPLVAHPVEHGHGVGGALAIDGHHAEGVEDRTHHRVPPQALLRDDPGRTRQAAEQREDGEAAPGGGAGGGGWWRWSGGLGGTRTGPPAATCSRPATCTRTPSVRSSVRARALAKPHASCRLRVSRWMPTATAPIPTSMPRNR